MVVQIKNLELRHSINSMEFNFHLLEDNDLSQIIVDDCLKLLNCDSFDVSDIRTELWFKRLWNLLVFGSNKQRVENAQTVAECINILIEVLENYLSFHPRNCSVFKHLLSKLQQKPSIFQYFAEMVKSYEFEIRIEHNAVSLINHQKIYTWQEAQKVYLIKMMILAAYADDILSYEEEQLIQWTIDALLQENKNKRVCRLYLANPQNPQELINRLGQHEDYDFRITIYQHCLRVMVVDQRLRLSDLDLIHKLEHALGIALEERCSQKYLRSHFLHPDNPLDQVLKWNNFRNEDDIAIFGSHLRHYVYVFSFQYIQPLLIKLSQYFECEASTSFQEIIGWFSPERIRDQLLDQYDKVLQKQMKGLRQIFLSRPGDLLVFEEQFKKHILQEGAALDKQLLQLAYVTDNLIEDALKRKDSTSKNVCKSHCLKILLPHVPLFSVAEGSDLIESWEVHRFLLLKTAMLFHYNLVRFTLDSIMAWVPTELSIK
ncbi:MAG: TerB family tellurite resistance protein [SAR324 cluster bacterium]|nr:TerB family tellurite resistance protein [SAR324 cluster bacterium]